MHGKRKKGQDLNQDFRNKMSITLPLESDLSPHILVKELGLVQVK